MLCFLYRNKNKKNYTNYNEKLNVSTHKLYLFTVNITVFKCFTVLLIFFNKGRYNSFVQL